MALPRQKVFKETTSAEIMPEAENIYVLLLLLSENVDGERNFFSNGDDINRQGV